MSTKNTQVLKRKDVLKLIDNLTNGQYLKGHDALVTNDRQHLCCLGVWADQHGCVWHDRAGKGWIPSLPGKNPPKPQSTATLEPALSFGLSQNIQNQLTSLNDDNDDWNPVLTYLVTEVLPKAK